ncbi:PorP/SprF family type IX secretion system membrane protein [Neotamlana sargassicola]|nr:PorP/SprF family type IX secretion system membrane protein [Tamlana sargassicola]
MPCLILFILFLQQISAQEQDGVVALQLPVRNSLRFNKYAINPTFSFVREQNKYVSFTNKREWVGFENAPQTYLFSYSGRFKENLGAGLGLFQQNYGILTTFGGVANIAYNAVINRDQNLTFGLNLAAYKSGVNSGDVVTNYQDPSLQNIPSNTLITINPGINYGTMFFDFGVSLNNIVAYNFTTSQMLEDNPEQSIQGHIMYTGYADSRGFFDESKFTGFVRSEFKKDQTILSGVVMLTVPKGIWAQVGYNTFYGASGGIGFNVTNNIGLEYNYEKAIGELNNFGSSHEITLAYKFNNNNKRFIYSGDEDEQGLLNSNRNKKRYSPRRKTTSKKPVVKAKPEADTSKETKINAEAENNRLAEEAKKQAEAEAAAKLEEERVAAETNAKAEAEKNRLAEEAKKQAEAEAAAKLEQERLAAEANAKAEAEKKRLAEEAKKQAEAEAAAKLEQERLAAEANAKAEAEKNRLAEEAKKQAEAEAAAKLEEERLAAEAKAKAEAEKNRLAEEAKKQAEAEAAAKLEQERLAAEAKAKAEAEKKRLAEEAEKALDTVMLDGVLIPASKDKESLEMKRLTELTVNARIDQQNLINRLKDAVASRKQDLADLKEENDLSEKGIYKQPKPFKSTSAENAKLEAIKSEIDDVLKSQSSRITKLESLYKTRLKNTRKAKDEVNTYYASEIEKLKSQQAEILKTRQILLNQLVQIKEDTDFERKRRIKRAAFDNEQERYNKDRGALKALKENTTVTEQTPTISESDFGEVIPNNILIINRVANVEAGYYLVLAVHSDTNKRDDFVRKVLQFGDSNVDFFYDVNSSKYYIYTKVFNDLASARSAMQNNKSTLYLSKSSIVNIQN